MEKDLKEQVRSEYREEVEKYIKYIPWLQQRAGAKALSIYNGEGIGEHSVRFPVYDGATLNFVKELSNSKFMDRNYPYVYSRNRIRTVQDEKDDQEGGDKGYGDSLRYPFQICTGRNDKRSFMGSGSRGRHFLEILLRMKEIMEFWDKPLA